jgi:hypothetical protein
MTSLANLEQHLLLLRVEKEKPCQLFHFLVVQYNNFLDNAPTVP